jgi:hypothetical protein
MALILLEQGELVMAQQALRDAEGTHTDGFIAALFAVVSALVAVAAKDRAAAEAALARARLNEAFCASGSELSVLIGRADRQLQALGG